VNRVVLGLQTLDDNLRERFGRRGKTPRDDMLDAFFTAEGIVHCVDLITGIPGQTREGLARELGRVLAYRPEHVSAYLLSVEKGTPLEKRLAPTGRNTKSNNDSASRSSSRRWSKAVHALRGVQFSASGFESRHNMKYWTFAPYFGYGPGRIRSTGRTAFQRGTVSAYLDGPWERGGARRARRERPGRGIPANGTSPQAGIYALGVRGRHGNADAAPLTRNSPGSRSGDWPWSSGKGTTYGTG
jgi:oxygen-independent coproporphyrinogen-3 oxidase